MNGKAEVSICIYVNGQDTQGKKDLEKSGVLCLLQIYQSFCRAWYSYFRGKVSYEQWYKKNMDTLKNIVEPYLQK